MLPVIVVQHVLAEGLGRIESLLREGSVDLQFVPPDAVMPPGGCHHASGLIVLGGPMGVYEADRHPRLRDEMRLIEEALKAQLPTLGLCLGSQLLAAVLGARVYPGPAKELGWHEVVLEEAAKRDCLFRGLPARFHALHWHGDVFDLPKGASRLARSAMTQCQAFSYGPSAWGLLFHLEAGASEMRAMAEAFPDEVRAGETTPAELVESTARHEAASARLASIVFGRWVELVRGVGDNRHP
jgi:GMP synthase (glutamine-hydrolysing)